MLRNYFAHEEGQGLVEYGLVLLLIAIAVVTVLTTLGIQLDAAYNAVVNTWP